MEALRTDILGSRALNASRKLHLPTYVATRFLLETVAGKKASCWINEVIPRKYLLQDQLTFHTAVQFKKIGEDQKSEYREFLVPSPTALLAEVILLGYLSQVDEFKKSDRVYSYIWPSSIKCPYNFEHYISGYRKRNDDISTYLSLNNDKLVIVADIEKFYPSIEQKIVKRRFEEKLESSNLPLEIRSFASKLLNDLCHHFPEGKGVATGPEFSHLLGDIALQNFDDVLSEKFGDAYFRYVDDIILIVDPSEKNSAIKLLESLAEEEKLTINPTKNDVLTSELWQKYGPHNESKVKDDSFEALLFQIKTYLQVNPESESSLASILEEAGFCIPLSRLSSASKTSSFATKLIGLISIGWKVALSAAMANDIDILKQANIVRNKVHSELKKFTESDIPNGSTLRKWHLQKLRYLTNRAVYLFPYKEIKYLIPKLEDIPEFVDTVALLKTLISQDYSEIIDKPGAALSACAGLLKQRKVKLKGIKISQESTSANIECAAVFALWDVANIAYTNIPLENNDIVEYLKFSSGVSGYERHIDSFNYLDEIKSLAINADKSDSLRVLESRLYDSEGTVLDALNIGWNSEY